MTNYIIKTERLGLRNWQTKDIAPAKTMNCNDSVMEFFPNLWSQKQTEDFIQRMRKHFRKHEFCYFAVDELETGKFIGFIGLMHQTYTTLFRLHQCSGNYYCDITIIETFWCFRR